MQSMTCRAQSLDGTPCRNRPLHGSEQCRWHQQAQRGLSLQVLADADEFDHWLRRYHAAAQQVSRSADDTLVVVFPPSFLYDVADPLTGECTTLHGIRMRFPVAFYPVGHHAWCRIGGDRIPIACTPALEVKLRTRRQQDGGDAVACPHVQRPVRRGRPLPPNGVLATELPHTLRQITSEEPRALIEAIVHGRVSRRWRTEAGGLARVFLSQSGQHEVWVHLLDSANDADPTTVASWLDATLQAWDLDVAFLALIVLSALVDATQRHAPAVATGAAAPVVDLSTDDLLRALGKTHPGDELGLVSRRGFGSSDERDRWRRWVREQLLRLSATTITGRRRGVYRDPVSRRVTDTYRDEGLFYLIDQETQWAGDGPGARVQGVPLRLRIHGGGLLRAMAQNRTLLQYIGDLEVLTRIPSGKATGQWARALGLAFAQLLRERAYRPAVPLVFTRRELLTRFPPAPTVDDVVGSGNPKRLLQYWRDASAELERLGWWEMANDPPGPVSRYQWHDGWLDQALAIRPGVALTSSWPRLQAMKEL